MPERQRFAGGFLFWTLLVSATLAAPDPDGAAPLVESLKAALPSSGDVLVAASGPEAHGAAVTALASALLDASRLALIRVPTTGDVEALALAEADRAGLTCVVLLSPGLDGAWSTQLLGGCPSDSEGEGGATESADGAEGTPAEDAKGPQASTTQLSEALWAQRERRFNQERLVLEPASAQQQQAGVRWSVFDGRGASLDAPALAALAGDEEMLLGLADEAKQADRHTQWLRWGGVATLVASPLPLIGLEAGAPEVNQDRVFTTVFIGAVGAALTAVAPAAGRGLKARQRHPANYYREEDAEDVVVAHNKSLFAELELGRKPEASAEPATEGAVSEAADTGVVPPAPDASSASKDASSPPAAEPAAPTEEPAAPAEEPAAPAEEPAEPAAPAEEPQPRSAGPDSEASASEAQGGVPSQD